MKDSVIKKEMRIYRYISLGLCILLMCLCVTGCKDKEDVVEEGKNYIYYIDKEGAKLVPKEYEISSEIVDKQIEELLEQLKLNTDDVDITKAIPDKVMIQDYALEDGILNISFNADYYGLDKAREVMMRAAVVLTLNQLEGVEYVSFSVLGDPIKKTNGEVVGNMQSSDFATNLDSNKQVYNKDEFVIYYANQSGTKLTKYKYEAEYSSDVSKEQLVLNKLIEGPGEEEGYIRTLSGNAQVVSIRTMDNICYVTFGANFLTEATTVPDELVIYSIVNTLSELPHIHKVQILVDGQTDAIYHSKISLSQPFSRNLDYIEKADETQVSQ